MSKTSSSPRTSQCSTASTFSRASSSSVTTAQLPSISNVSNDGSSISESSLPSGSLPTLSSLTPSSSASAGSTSGSSTSTNSSAFSVIGKTLTRLIQSCYATQPATGSSSRASRNKDGSRRLIRKQIIRKKIVPPSTSSISSLHSSSTGSASSMSAKRGIQKWIFMCKGCSRPITRSDVKANNAIFAMDGAWHRSHLVCFKCSVNIGEEYRQFIASGPDGKQPCCLDCHMESEHPTCAKCNLPLFETCIEFDEKRMHQNCFVCERCKAPFEGGQYALIHGKPYDLDCYYFKAYETSFAPTISNSLFDLPIISPPPMAESFLKSASDSTTSLPGAGAAATTPPPPTTSPTGVEDQTYFKKNTTELVSLCDVGHPLPPEKAKKELSAEIFETDHIKFPLNLPPPPPPSTSPAKSPSLLDSKEKVVSPAAGADTRARSPEKWEDFVNGHEELAKHDKKSNNKAASPSGNNKKEHDSIRIEEKKEEPKNNEKPNPSTISIAAVEVVAPHHPDTYAAAAALHPPADPVVGGTVDGKSDGAEIKKAEEKMDDKKEEPKKSDDIKKDDTKVEEKKDGKPTVSPIAPAHSFEPHHPDTYAAAALPPHADPVVGVDGKKEVDGIHAAAAGVNEKKEEDNTGDKKVKSDSMKADEKKEIASAVEEKKKDGELGAADEADKVKQDALTKENEVKAAAEKNKV